MISQALFLVPTMPPDICGVGDYSLDLARALRKNFGVSTLFLLGKQNCSSVDSIDDFPVHRIAKQTGKVFRRQLGQIKHDLLVIQYSGYGFDRRGIPSWIPSGIQNHPTPIVTMFHEVYASGPVTSSAFWLSWQMKRIARKIQMNSRWVMTNREESRKWLGEKSIVLPVFSSLGEPDHLPAFSDRPNWLALFPYQANGDPNYVERLQKAIEITKVDKLIALGRRTKWITSDLPVQVVETGVLPATEVSKFLSKCRYGFFSYAPDCMGKSSILAAFAAHQLCVICNQLSSSYSEAIRLGFHVIHPNEFEDSLPHHQIAQNLHNWYRRHDLMRTAETYSKLLNGK